ncbi:MAG: hypothetical protein ACRC80_07775 [Waterburya sp.]
MEKDLERMPPEILINISGAISKQGRFNWCLKNQQLIKDRFGYEFVGMKDAHGEPILIKVMNKSNSWQPKI